MSRHFDLAVIGSGSGNSIVDEAFADRNVAILEKGTFGGTCLNVGCIPTKMFVYPADLAHAAAHGDRLGVDTRFDGVTLARDPGPDLRPDRPDLHRRPVLARRAQPGTTLFEGHARFVGERTLDTGTGEVITADQVVIAAGSRPLLPDVPGLDEVPFHTSDTVMRIDDVPRRLLIVGGGFVAAEFAHVFSAFGSQVTVVNRSDVLLRQEDDEVAPASPRSRASGGTSAWARRSPSWRRTTEGCGPRSATAAPSRPTCCWSRPAAAPTPTGSTWTRPASTSTTTGWCVVDEHQRTTAEGVWALGDVSNRYQLKHVSNHEARVVQHNLLHPDDPGRLRPPVRAERGVLAPADGQRRAHRAARPATRASSTWSRGRTTAAPPTAGRWRTPRRFAKVLADPRTGLLLGAHLIGPQASNLIQPLVQAMAFGTPAHDVARDQYWIHPALMEVVENVLLALPATS